MRLPALLTATLLSAMPWTGGIGPNPVPAAPIRQEPSDVTWGEVIDPDGDCGITQDGDRVTIEVPGTPHDLSAELDRMNAPRIVREVAGDFIAEVRVAGVVHPRGESRIEGRTPYNGAGLLIWVDDATYLRFERAGITREVGGELTCYANFELRDGGRRETGKTAGIDDTPLIVRVERRGVLLVGSASYDGLNWTTIGVYEVDLPERLQVGVAAINSASEPFRAELEGLRIFTPGETGK